MVGDQAGWMGSILDKAKGLDISKERFGRIDNVSAEIDSLCYLCERISEAEIRRRVSDPACGAPDQNARCCR